jgi:hypothetical protein
VTSRDHMQPEIGYREIVGAIVHTPRACYVQEL